MNLIERYFVKRFIRKSIKSALNADIRDMHFMLEEMTKAAREMDTESNDTIIYAWLMHKMDCAANLQLLHVTQEIRFSK